MNSERTLNMLFSAQRSRLSGYPVAGPPSPSPDASHSHLSAAATTSRPTQRSLHSFWHIKSHPKPSASSMPPPVDLGSLSPANCESCDVDLTATMDVDGYGLEADYMCEACGKRVCSHCSVTNLGEQRRCLGCAGPKVGRGGLPWPSASSVW